MERITLQPILDARVESLKRGLRASKLRDEITAAHAAGNGVRLQALRAAYRSLPPMSEHEEVVELRTASVQADDDDEPEDEEAGSSNHSRPAAPRSPRVDDYGGVHISRSSWSARVVAGVQHLDDGYYERGFEAIILRLGIETMGTVGEAGEVMLRSRVEKRALTGWLSHCDPTATQMLWNHREGPVGQWIGFDVLDASGQEVLIGSGHIHEGRDGDWLLEHMNDDPSIGFSSRVATTDWTERERALGRPLLVYHSRAEVLEAGPVDRPGDPACEVLKLGGAMPRWKARASSANLLAAMKARGIRL
jgi:hypothetical protein